MIRKYKGADLKSVIDIWHKASILAHPFLEITFVAKVKKDMLEIYIPNASDSTWVYEKNNNVIAFISLMSNEIGGLFVKPEFHSKGIGTKLVNYVQHIYDKLEVEVFEKNVIGRAFYDKYGFTQINSYYHEQSRQDILRMTYS